MSSISDRLLSALGGSYTIERELTGGGMALVFMGEDHDLARKVVIKILPPELAATVSAERFRREILTVARLQHPHIVPILKAGEVDGLPYFVMPYVDGESIDVRLRRTKTFGVRETLGIMKDAARALAFAHERGVVHRDIKPGNILLASGSATVTDFGVAKALSSARRSGEKGNGNGLTNTGMSLGTILYMAPEQAAGDPDIDGRADIYSLGVTAYEMLAGAAPFAHLGPREMLTARLTLPPPPLSAVRKDVPVGLERLIAKCLAIDPADRPQSAASLVDALEDPETMSSSFASAAKMAHHGRRASRALIGGLPLICGILGSARVLAESPSGGGSSKGETTWGTPKTPELGVVAVLPFVSLGADSANAYLATGVTNAVAGKLMRTRGLRVLAPGLPRSVRRRSDTTITASLDARLVLEGTVERVGDRLRVTARLSSTADDVMQWADVFDRDVKDIFTVEDEIADAIVASVTPMTGQKGG